MKLADVATTPEVTTSHGGGARKQVFLAAGRIPPVMQAARVRFGPGDSAPPHSHPDMAELFWVAAGRGTMVVDAQPVAQRDPLILRWPMQDQRMKSRVQQNNLPDPFGSRVSPGYRFCIAI